MRIEIEPGIRLFVDFEGPQFVPDGPVLRQRPTVILLHGGPGFDHSAFRPRFPRLADVAHLVYVDHRGHGRSDRRPPEEWTLDTFADDVVRLCDVLGIDKPIVLGQSFGGFVAQRYLARHPGHPSKVILSSTSPHLGLERKLAMFEKFGGRGARDAAERFWRQPGTQTWAAYSQACRPLYNTTPQDESASQRTIHNLDILYASAAGEQQRMDLLPGLANVRCPVLVLAGEEDPVCPVADARDIAAALPPPWGQFVAIPGAGHGAYRDRPDETFEVLRRFILQ
ncbi:MAG TPA: alpha/beta hydrolase [Burkholderiaceae bacterium]|nr:alpha/beta hydrolase [Burkholderiaceae bacterium]